MLLEAGCQKERDIVILMCSLQRGEKDRSFFLEECSTQQAQDLGVLFDVIALQRQTHTEDSNADTRVGI